MSKLNKEDILAIGQLAEDHKNTYQEIGNDFQITRERVRQILNEFFPGTMRRRKFLKLEDRSHTCIICGIYNEKVIHKIRKIGFICQKCLNKRKNKWHFMYDACIDCGSKKNPYHSSGRCESCYEKWAYHNLPGRKEKCKRLTYKWNREHPEKRKEMTRKAVDKYMKKLRLDPIRYKKYLEEASIRHHERMKNDPEYRERQKIYSKRKREKQLARIAQR